MPSDILKIDKKYFLLADKNNDRLTILNSIDLQVKDVLLNREFLKVDYPDQHRFVFEGNICVSDRDNDCVQVFDKN